MLKLGIALAALHLAEAFAPAPTPLAARRLPCTRPAAAPLVAMSESGGKGSSFSLPFFGGKEAQVGEKEQAKEDDDKMTIEKVASLGLAGVLSIAVAETVFWVLSFPASELLYFASTGEWIDLLSQEGQIKFLAFSAGWGALGGAIAQYRTVLTAAAMTPWMDRVVVKPYIQPAIDNWRNKDDA